MKLFVVVIVALCMVQTILGGGIPCPKNWNPKFGHGPECTPDPGQEQPEAPPAPKEPPPPPPKPSTPEAPPVPEGPPPPPGPPTSTFSDMPDMPSMGWGMF